MTAFSMHSTHLVICLYILSAICRLHLHNRLLKSEDSKVGQSERLKEESLDTVDQFGFHTVTCCGRIPQDNEWNKDWVVSGGLEEAPPVAASG